VTRSGGGGGGKVDGVANSGTAAQPSLSARAARAASSCGVAAVVAAVVGDCFEMGTILSFKATLSLTE
jgi:hypothetical protein